MARESISQRSSCDYVIAGSGAGGPLACSLSKRSGNPGRRGFAGCLETNKADPAFVIRDGQLLRVIKAGAKDALVELFGRPLRFLEHVNTFFNANDWRAQQSDLQGLWIMPLATTRAGRRNGTREYIRDVQSRFPDNIAVKTNALATRVLFDDNTAVGVEFVRRMMGRASDVIERELVPGEDADTREQIREFVRNEARCHHASCICKMGLIEAEMAVVDDDFRVHGIRNLR
jgi:choline dehydrogenase-like flavoprotein